MRNVNFISDYILYEQLPACPLHEPTLLIFSDKLEIHKIRETYSAFSRELNVHEIQRTFNIYQFSLISLMFFHYIRKGRKNERLMAPKVINYLYVLFPFTV